MISNLIQYGKLLMLDRDLKVAERHFLLAVERAKKTNLNVTNSKLIKPSWI